jgi:hypothetical protein
MGYTWMKKGSLKIAGEKIVPVVGEDVTELLEEVSQKTIECLLRDRRIEDDTERKKKTAALMAEQNAKIAKIKAKVKAKKEAKKKGKKE